MNGQTVKLLRKHARRCGLNSAQWMKEYADEIRSEESHEHAQG